MTTKLKLNQIAPVPPSKSEVNTALENKIDLTSEQEISGTKIFTETLQMNASSSTNTAFALTGVNSERTQRFITAYEGDGINSGAFAHIIFTKYYNDPVGGKVGFRVGYNTNTGYKDLSLRVNADGTSITQAPTPATTDNSTQIATTAFVKSAMSTWNAVTLTPVTTYCTNVAGNYAACYYNPYLKLCTVGFNLCLAATTIPASTAIVTGFPKALHHFGCALCNGTINIRAYISTTGALMLDGAQTLSSTVWVDGSVTYPYSSL